MALLINQLDEHNESGIIYLIKNNMFNIRINKSFIYEEKTNKYTKEELIKIINNLAKEKIKANLKQDEKILLQKTFPIKNRIKINCPITFK